MKYCRKAGIILLMVCFLLVQMPGIASSYEIIPSGADQDSYVSLQYVNYQAGILQLRVSGKLSVASGISNIAALLSYDNSLLTLVNSANTVEYAGTNGSVAALDSGSYVRLIQDREGSFYAAAERNIYKQDGRTGVFFVFYTNEQPAVTTASEVGLFDLYFKVSGSPADLSSVLAKDSIRIASYEQDQAIMAGLIPANNGSALKLENADTATREIRIFGAMPDYQTPPNSSVREMKVVVSYPGSENSRLGSLAVAAVGGQTVPSLAASPSAVALNITALDTAGAAMAVPANLTVSLSKAPASANEISGISYNAASGQIEIASTAQSCNVVVTVASGNVSAAPVGFAVTRAAALPATLTIGGGPAGTVAVPVSGVLSCAAYTATVRDQYGETMSGQTVTWSIVPGPPAGVSIDAGGAVQVASTAQSGAITVQAACGTLTATTNLTISRESSVPASIDFPPGLAATVDLPVGDLPAEAGPFRVVVQDQFGQEIENPNVTWTLTPPTGSASTGVHWDDLNKKLVVSQEAKAIILDTTGLAFTLTAAVGGQSASHTITVRRAAPQATSLVIIGPDTLTVPATGIASTAYTAQVLDQYGEDYPYDRGYAWLINYGQGVDVGSNSGIVTIAPDAAKGVYSLFVDAFLISSTSLNAQKRITVTDIVPNWAALGFSGLGFTYGDHKSSAFAANFGSANAVAGTANLGGVAVNGTFSLVEPDAYLPAGEQVIGVDFTVAAGQGYDNQVISSGGLFALDVAKKELSLDAALVQGVAGAAQPFHVYDGTTNATADLLISATALHGAIPGDVVAVASFTATLRDANVPLYNDQTVLADVSGITLSAAAQANYTLAAAPISVAVEMRKRQLASDEYVIPAASYVNTVPQTYSLDLTAAVNGLCAPYSPGTYQFAFPGRDSRAIYAAIPAVQNSVLTYTTVNNSTITGQDTVVFMAHFQNFTSVEFIHNITVGNHSFVDVTVTLEAPGGVYGTPLAEPTPRQVGSGAEIDPHAGYTFTYAGTLRNGTAYPASATPPTQAGQYTVKATLVSESHRGESAAVPFTIAPRDIANATLAFADDVSNLVYNGAPHRPALDVTDGAIAITAGDYTVAYTANTQAGTASISLAAAATGNYTGSLSAPFTIRKAPAQTVAALEREYQIGNAYPGQQIDLGALLTGQPGSVVGVGSVNLAAGSAAIIENHGFVAADGALLTFDIKAGAAAGESATLTATVSSTNYADTTIQVVITMVDKAVPSGTPSITGSLKYGQALSSLPIGGSMEAGGLVVLGSFSWDAPLATPAVGTADHAWAFTPQDTAAYAKVYGTLAVSVAKATPSATPQAGSVSSAGVVLSNVSLTAVFTNPYNGLAVSGTLTWDNPAATVVRGTSYGWTFSPADALNYEAVTGSLIPWPAAASLPNSGNGGGGSGTTATIVEEQEQPLSDQLEGADLSLTQHVQYIYGYEEDGTVRPDRNITRAEVTAIFHRLALTSAAAATVGFGDVGAGDWFYEAVMDLAGGGVLNGYGDGNFRPNQPMTRAEFAKVAVLFAGLPPAGSNTFADLADDHWAAGYLNAAASQGWISGFEDGTVRADQNITRAQVVTIINRMLERRIHAEDIPSWAPSFSDLSSSHWAYADIIEAASTHNLERLADTYERWLSAEEMAELMGQTTTEAASETEDESAAESGSATDE